MIGTKRRHADAFGPVCQVVPDGLGEWYALLADAAAVGCTGVGPEQSRVRRGLSSAYLTRSWKDGRASQAVSS